MVLLLKTARDHWRSYLVWTIGLLAMVGIQLSVYPTVRSSAAGLATFLDNYPEALKQIFRMEDYTSGAGYLSTELFSMMLPLIFISIGASWGANATAILSQVLLAAVTLLSLAIGIGIVDLSLGTTKIMAGALTGALLGILFNAVATFLGAAWGKRSIALGGAIALAIAGFLFFSLAPLVNTFERITPINPFQWTLGSRPLFNGIDLGYTFLSLFVASVFYGAALVVFKRRDIQA